ncbi:MAG TPA: hypothetical protein VL049_09650 [Candidatus Dormibacteraeota bacterium]|nr:hypothetical protein [Candidatus Dormibacteraeota bacterium]
MSAAELATPLGGERVELCVFKVAIDDELVSRCEANAAGRRAAFYERTASEPRARQGAA